MKKKTVKISAVIILLAAVCICCWFIPVKPLKGAVPGEITKISVRGRPELENITDPEIVRTIAENIYSCGAKRCGISFGRMGYAYIVEFYKGDEFISSFSLCSNDTARDNKFFFCPQNGTYCKDYIDSLPGTEAKQ